MNDNRFIIFNGNDNGGEMEFFTHYRFQMPKKAVASRFVSKDYSKGLQIVRKLQVDHMFAFGF